MGKPETGRNEIDVVQSGLGLCLPMVVARGPVEVLSTSNLAISELLT